MYKISKRIKFLASLLSKADKTIADVGCDHGYLGYLHLKNYDDAFVYFTDISFPCLQKAKALMEEKMLINRSDFVCTNGLIGIPQNKLDCAVISGMGSNEILKIIQQSPEVKKYILQPMKNVLPLKQELIKLNFKITYDIILKDSEKFYEFLIIEKGINNLTEKQLYLGKTNLENNSSDFIDYLHYRKQQLTRNLKFNKDNQVGLQELTYIDEYLNKKE